MCFNQHVASRAHLKKEAEIAKKERGSLPDDKVKKLKERNERKRQRRLEKKREQRAAQGHVWGEHKKPEKGLAASGAERSKATKPGAASALPRAERPTVDQRPSRPHAKSDAKGSGRRASEGAPGVGKHSGGRAGARPEKRRKSAGVCVD